MRGRYRRWTALTAALVASGWLSTLTPATATTTTPPKPGPNEALSVVSAPTPPADQAVPADQAAPGPVVAQGKVDCKKQKCIALTFDDGPMSSTSKLLKILAKRKVKATFFLIGQNVKAHPSLVRQELAAGHEIGNHSYTHADLAAASASKVRSELSKTQSAIHKAAGITPVLMRPPGGATDSTVTSITRKMKLAQILWAVDPKDWRDRNTKLVERRVVGGARRGYIILMHDIHPTTVAAVPNIIKRLAAKGYVFVTVSQLFGHPLTPGKKYTKR